MNFNDWNCNGLNGICNRNRSMGISSAIQNNSVEISFGSLNMINNRTFVIALKIFNFSLAILRSQSFQVFFETGGTIKSCLPFTQKIKIGPVDDQNFYHKAKLFIYTIFY